MEFLLFVLYPLALLRLRWIVAPLALHAALIAQSAFAHGRIPLIGTRETLSFLAFCVAALTPLFGRGRGRGPYLSLTLSLIMLLLLGSIVSPEKSGPLPPVLRTIWFELHVILSFVSYALFGIGMVFGALRLRGGGVEDEHRQYTALLWGYALFSAAMIFGGVWAYYAWGTYWLWTPKELWTTIVWLFYSLYLHARIVRGWSGRAAAWLGVAGFAIVLFTYVGVGLLMKSSHEF